MSLLVYSYVADLIFGDPRRFPHPVKGIGRLIVFLENKLRGNETKWRERVKGVILVLAVVGASTLFAYLVLYLCGRINPLLGKAAWVFLAYTTLSVKDLILHAEAVARSLKGNDITEARVRLSRIVGRDTRNLSKEEIVKAALESVAESTNDGIVAPLFYLILGGPVLAVAYKAVNTLDSMVGHKDERFVHFGWFSAKIDDALNFVPARVSGFLIAASSFFLGGNFADSFKVMTRDGRKHPSPNSGVPEAAMAGALGIRLGGPSVYEGEVVEKPYLGEDKKTVEVSMIDKALAISFMASLLALSSGVLLKWII
ncbi:MAG: adenosylcobinamide-phosphate synthase CbiB [Candidatus Omnitrophica bacterium]|nr:adenosylcobinamide-phosphate synthase CbiB [Candidatus Omnitrophota bacterium]